MNRYLHPKYMQNQKETIQQFLLATIVSINSQIYLYQQLLQYAPNEISKEYIQILIEEEASNLVDITNDYVRYFGPVPPYYIRRYEFSDYREGLSIAINNAIATIRIARDLARQLATEDSEYPDIREGFRRGVTSYLVQLDILMLLFNLTFHYYYPEYSGT